MYTSVDCQEDIENTKEVPKQVIDIGECKNCDADNECLCNGKIDTEEVKEEVKEEEKEEVKEEVKEAKKSFKIIDSLLSFFTKYLGCSNKRADVMIPSNKPVEVEISKVAEPIIEKNVI
jgi:hypothetical protein